MRRAVFIATERYADERFATLRAPAQDAKALSALLTDPDVGGFSSGRVLVDETKSEVELALEDVLSGANVDDLVLIYYSGHGKRDDFGDFFLTFVNTRSDRLGSTALSAHTLQTMITKSGARSVVVILDCCYSGAYLSQNLKGNEQQSVSAALHAGDGRYILCSSDAVRTSLDAGPDDPDQLSQFTRSIIEGISSGQADVRKTGYITPDDLWTWTSQNLSAQGVTPTKGGQVSAATHLARVRDRSSQRHDGFSVFVGDLLGPVVYHPEYGPRIETWPEAKQLSIPVGNFYRPGATLSEPVMIDFARSDYHVGIAGGPRSGKSTLMQTMVLALSLIHTPAEVSFIGLEASGNNIGSMSGLPHFSSYVGPSEISDLSGVRDELGALIAQRQKKFKEVAITSASEMREHRRGLELTEWSDVFVVIDGIKRLLKDAAGTDILRMVIDHGSSYGVHLIAAAEEWSVFPQELQAHCSCKIEFQLSNPAESLATSNAARDIAAGGPGWAILENNRMKVATPMFSPLTGTPDGQDDRPERTQEIIRRFVSVANEKDVEVRDFLRPSDVMDPTAPVDLLHLLNMPPPGFGEA